MKRYDILFISVHEKTTSYNVNNTHIFTVDNKEMHPMTMAQYLSANGWEYKLALQFSTGVDYICQKEYTGLEPSTTKEIERIYQENYKE